MRGTAIVTILLIALLPALVLTTAVQGEPVRGTTSLKKGGTAGRPAAAKRGGASLTLSWAPVKGATSYNIYYGTRPGVNRLSPMKVRGVKTTRHTLRGLTPGTTYYFTVTAATSSGESVESAEIFATANVFSAADLAGTWYFTTFSTGADPGWGRGRVRMDSSGRLSILDYESSDGADPAARAPALALGPKGTVTGKGVDGRRFRGHMAADKQLIVGLGTDGSAGRLTILQRDAGKAYSRTTLTGNSFAFHQISSRAGSHWRHGLGSLTDDAIAVASSVSPSGKMQPVPPRRYDLASTGVVTVADNPSFRGTLSHQGKLLVATETTGGEHHFAIYQLLGQSFVQSELTGHFKLFVLEGGTGKQGRVSVSSTGDADFIPASLRASSGSHTFSLSRLGIVTDRVDPAFHGALSYDRGLLVATTSTSALAIAVR